MEGWLIGGAVTRVPGRSIVLIVEDCSCEQFRQILRLLLLSGVKGRFYVFVVDIHFWDSCVDSWYILHSRCLRTLMILVDSCVYGKDGDSCIYERYLRIFLSLY